MEFSSVIIISALIAITACSDSCPSTTLTNKCNRLCQPPEGECQDDGYCLCKKGYTGPDNKPYAKDNSRVEASHCLLTCNDNPANPSLSKNQHQPCLYTCDARCQSQVGSCVTDGEYKGKCLCWWGHTGPNALFIETGGNRGRIYADYCKPNSDCTGWSVLDRWCADSGISFAYYK
ncbi:tenascin-like [Clytia hemisphaerica]|uniref:Uncharacterized protein n=1 Tax=Clytia hemisphaerica TaxID=252671 RepID=A0A7M5X468_9CNID|eukprot:TCONS_00071742-protein